MKVAVEIVVEIDPESYRDEYGEPSAKLDEIREYVRRAIESAGQSALDIVGADVRLKDGAR